MLSARAALCLEHTIFAVAARDTLAVAAPATHVTARALLERTSALPSCSAYSTGAAACSDNRVSLPTARRMLCSDRAGTDARCQVPSGALLSKVAPTLQLTPCRPLATAATASSHLRKVHRERRLMGFSQQQLFSVVADVSKYSEFVPWCRKSLVTKHIDDEHYEADLEVGFQVFSERYTSVVTVHQPRLVVSEAADSEVFNHMITRWELAPGPTKSSTWLTFTTDFSFKNPVYAQTAGMFFDQVVSKMICAFDARCREVYRTRVKD